MKNTSAINQIRDEKLNKDEWNGNSKVFRAYFHGMVGKDGRTCPAEKIKGMPGHTWNEVCTDQNFGAALNDGYVDISFDSNELSQSFWDMAEQNQWKCLILENPENGHIHSYWKKSKRAFQKDGQDKKLAVGLIADIHSGDTYIRLKTNGINRFPPSFEPEEIQEVPEELYPVATKINLWDLSEGNGRNNALSGMAKYLTHNSHFSKEQIRRILTNTNTFVFAEPLPESEVRTILRDETFEGLKEIPKLNMLNGAELQRMDCKPVEFIIEGLLPVGLTILASPPKYGKSWMCMNMALSVASGKDFLKFKVNQCGVLYLALEDRFDRLKQRIKQIQGDEPFPAGLNMVIESQTLDDGFIQQMEDVLIAHSEIRLIIIDTFVKIRGEAKRNESAYKTDSREAGIIKHFADSHNIAVVLVTHTRKGIDTSDPFINITGTYGVAGAADDMIVLTKEQRSDKNTKMSVNGRDVSNEEFALTFDSEHGTWMYAGDSWDEYMRKIEIETARFEYDHGNTKQTIVKILEENEGSWTGSCKALIEKSRQYGTPITKTAQKLGSEIALINGFLFEDGILHTEISRGSASKLHKFELNR